MDLPVYKITKDKKYSKDGIELGMDMFAHLSNPAILQKGFAFDKAKKLKFNDEMKLRVVAPLMMPMSIFRSDEDGEYFVQFEEDVIEEIFIDFMDQIDQGKKQKTNLDHEADEKAPSFVAYAWRVGKDPKADASWSEYGLDVPTGTIMVITQFRDKEYFMKEIVEQDRTGYSIEGMLGLKLVQNVTSKLNKLTKHKMKKVIFSSVKKDNFMQIASLSKWYSEIDQEKIIEGLHLTQTYTDSNGEPHTSPLSQGEYLDETTGLKFLVDTDGIVQKIINPTETVENKQIQNMENKKLKFEVAYLEDGRPININAETKEVTTVDNELNKVPLEDGTFKTADGKELIVKDGKVGEAMEAAADKVEDKPADKVEAADAPVADAAPKADAGKIDEASILAIVQPKLDELMQVIAELKAEVLASKPAETVTAEKLSIQNVEKVENQKAFALAAYNKFRSEY